MDKHEEQIKLAQQTYETENPGCSKVQYFVEDLLTQESTLTGTHENIAYCMVCEQ